MRPLIVSHYFPPIGGAGAQRPAKLARHLLGDSFSPIVLTGPGTTTGRWTPLDASLGANVPEDVPVWRVPGPEPSANPPRRARLERWFMLRTPWQRWWINGLTRTAREIEFDVFFTVMSPYTSATASAAIAAEHGKPWIADLGDPWALDEMMVYPTVAHRLRDLRSMRRSLASAAAVVTTTSEAARRIREEFPELASKPVVWIPMGYDAADFVGPPPVREDRAFRIVHTGYLHTDLGLRQRHLRRLRRGLGGGRPGVDILTRSHVYLLQAIERLVAEDPGLEGVIELHLAGVLSSSDREFASGSSVVRTLGYLSHADSIGLMRSADLLFLPMQGLPPGVRSGTVPGKTYEYLAAQRPILAAVPEGDARDILAEAGNARICDPADVAAIAAALRAEIERWQRGEPGAGPSADLLTQFEYPRLVREVEALLEDVVATGGRPLVRPASKSARPRVPPFGSVRPLLVPRNPSARLLVLAYYFPPIGGAGAQRSLKLVRYLPEAGYVCSVITGPGEASGRWTPTDRSLLDELPHSADLLRVAGPEPRPTGRWRARARRWLGVPSDWDRWWQERALALGASADPVDAVFASMSPYSSAGVAAELAERLGVPWIAGLRDLWALDEMMVYPTVAHRLRDLRSMRRSLASAAAVVTTTSEAARRIREQFPELASKPVVWIPNGYDAADFVAPPPVREDRAFRIVHTGYLHTDLGLRQRHLRRLRRGLGGGRPGVDILTRSHVYLLQAIERLVAEDPGLEGVIELHLAGVLSSSDREFASGSSVVRTLGYLSHADSIGLMRSADLLFLPMQGLPPGVRSGTVPGKTYEYLAAQRPILAAVPEGDARDILAEAGNARICDPADVAAIAAALRAEIERWQRGEPGSTVDPGYLARFERQTIAAQLATVIEEILPEQPSTLQTTGVDEVVRSADSA